MKIVTLFLPLLCFSSMAQALPPEGPSASGRWCQAQVVRLENLLSQWQAECDVSRPEPRQQCIEGLDDISSRWSDALGDECHGRRAFDACADACLVRLNQACFSICRPLL